MASSPDDEVTMSALARHTERQPVPGARVSDLNLNAVRDHIDIAVKRRGYIGPTDPEAYLVEHGCLVYDANETLAPSLAGIVAFAREPHHWVSVCGIDVAEFNGPRPNTTDLLLSRQLRGDLFTIIDRTVDLLWARINHRTHITGTERIEEHAYPLVVLRELTVNAVVHRDWSYVGSYIRIQIFPDRIEWISPGGFPGRMPRSGLTLETLLNAQVSRNPAIAQILYHAGRVESFGMGIDTVIDALQDMGARTPEVYDNGDIFLFRVWGQMLNDDTARTITMTPRQRRIVAEITARGACTTAELQMVLNENVRTIQRELRELVTAGIIIAEGSTSNRRYRLRKQ
jgi:ATP-dependent DNA helicase RecG